MTYHYADFGAVDFVRSFVRRHDASETSDGPLTLNTGLVDPDLAVASYVGHFYDDVGRLSRTVNFGTNKAPNASDRLGDSFSNGTSPESTWLAVTARPEHNTSGFENYLVSGVEYDERGLASVSIDAKGRQSKVLYDDLNSPVAMIENYVGGVTVEWDAVKSRWDVTAGLDPDFPDQNRVTSFSYFKQTSGPSYNWINRRTAHAADGPNQETDYVYGVEKGSGADNSLITTHEYLAEVRSPDESTGQAGTDPKYIVRHAYNRLGESRMVQDQNQTKHYYARDAAGRVLTDTASIPFGSDLDSRVAVLQSIFNSKGQLTDVKSWSGGGSPAVLDHVRYTYTSLHQIASIIQDPDSDLDASPSGHPARTVGYGYSNLAYDTPGDYYNQSRLTTQIYPTIGENELGTAISYNYDESWFVETPNPIDHAIGRVRSLSVVDTVYDPYPSTAVSVGDIAVYSFVGLGAISHVDLVQAGIQLDRTVDETGRRKFGQYGPGGSPNAPTQDGGAYPGWDRFGRVKRHSWVRTGYDLPNLTYPATRARELASFHYAYDKASNPILRQNARRGGELNLARDWVYEYDGLDRLIQANRGVVSSTYGGSATGPTPLTMENSVPGSRKWKLDTLGNWSKQWFDLDGPAGSPSFGSTEEQTRTHNAANELGVSVPASGIDAKSPLSLDFDHLDPSSPSDPSSGYDDNGSRRRSSWREPSSDDGFDFEYIYDAWNRLVEIRRVRVDSGVSQTGTYGVIARYAYNGLSWRTSKTTCGPTPLADNTAPALRERRYFTYNASWQLIVEEIDDDLADASWPGVTPDPEAEYGDPEFEGGIDRVAQQFFGIRGINDALYRREDRVRYVPEVPGDEEEEIEPVPAHIAPRAGNVWAGGYGAAYYQLSDPQFSVVGVVKASGGTRVDEVEYDPYGNARYRMPADLNHSGTVSIEDVYAQIELQGATPPVVASDFNDDGEYGSGLGGDSDDQFAYLDRWFVEFGNDVPRSRITRPYRPPTDDATPVLDQTEEASDNPYGYCGYYYDTETAAAKVLGPDPTPSTHGVTVTVPSVATLYYGVMDGWGGGLYHVRHRVYDPTEGRWLTRDPAGFVDGMNLYEYVAGRVISAFDPLGLSTCGPIDQIDARERSERLSNPYRPGSEEWHVQRLNNIVNNTELSQEMRDSASAALENYAQNDIESAPSAVVSAHRDVVIQGSREVGREVKSTYIWGTALTVAGTALTAARAVSEFADDAAGGARSYRSGTANAAAKGSSAKSLPSRSDAFRSAKDAAGVPRSAQPSNVYREQITDQAGYVEGRVYEFTKPDGSVVTIREHSLGHVKGGHGPHFNVEIRPPGGGPKQPLPGGGDGHHYFEL